MVTLSRQFIAEFSSSKSTLVPSPTSADAVIECQSACRVTSHGFAPAMTPC